ncbi:MAG: hypothetical protein ACJAV6_000279 [Candidatus Paceibacteria bacterium]|jgi:hypothetical protein
MKKNYLAFSTLTIISGMLHFLVVSMMHRENFVELWFFTAFGLAQLLLGIQVLSQKKKSQFLLLAVILNGVFLVLWVLTRVFNAPLATYSKGLTSFDSLISLFEIASLWFAVKIFKTNSIPIKKIILTGLLFTVLGLTSYGLVKASEKIFRSIPTSVHPHKHSIMDMFKTPVTASNVSTVNVMGIDMTKEQAKEHCKMNGMEQMEVCQQFQNSIEAETVETIIPQGHDNRDGHHN